jgi:hypothetical protein
MKHEDERWRLVTDDLEFLASLGDDVPDHEWVNVLPGWFTSQTSW